jgi:hypothetical protein
MQTQNAKKNRAALWAALWKPSFSWSKPGTQFPGYESVSSFFKTSVKVIIETRFVRMPDKPPVTATMTGSWYWVAPGSVRMETKGNEFTMGQDSTDFYPAGKPGNQHRSQDQDFSPQASTTRLYLTMVVLIGSIG